jgi:catechol 2,3-dioxygenase
MFTLGHVHLKVRDLDRAVEFYTTVFGWRVVERLSGQCAFLSGSGRHHDLALQAVGPAAQQPSRFAIRLYHVAFEVPDRAALARVYRRLKTEGVDAAAVDHGISWALYFRDPDGNGLEVYCDTRGLSNGRRRWQGHSARIPEARLMELARQAKQAA